MATASLLRHSAPSPAGPFSSRTSRCWRRQPARLTAAEPLRDGAFGEINRTVQSLAVRASAIIRRPRNTVAAPSVGTATLLGKGDPKGAHHDQGKGGLDDRCS